MIRILTLSNKPNYLPDAIGSVLTQTRRDIVHVVGFDSAERDWGDRYPPAVFFNEEARYAPMGDYVCWLSDDDLLLPNYVADLAGFLDTHPNAKCVYGRARVVLWHQDERQPLYLLPLDGLPVYDATNLPMRKIGSGMVMMRRSVLEKLSYPYVPEIADSEVARVCDGALLNAIAMVAPIYPVDAFVVINRITPESAHQYCTEDSTVGRRDWREIK